jgi:hypothetical protein
MVGTRPMLLAIAATAVAGPAMATAPATLCLAGMAWQGLTESDTSALRERMAQALTTVGVDETQPVDAMWCAGTSAEVASAQGQIFVQVIATGATARVQLKVVDAATAATVYLRTVGCPIRSFPGGIDFETAFEAALFALRRPSTSDDDDPQVAAAERVERSARAVLRAKGRQRARSSAATTHSQTAAGRAGPTALPILGWVTAGLGAALALGALGAGAEALVFNDTLRRRAVAGACVQRARGQYVQCDRSLRSDVDLLSLLVWATDGLWAAAALFGGSAAVLLWLGYAPTEAKENEAASAPAPAADPVAP